MRDLYEDLVRSHAAELFCFAYRTCGDRDMAEDLVAETFTEAWRSIDRLRDPGKGRGWLFQILRHRCAHWVRDQGRRIRATASVEDLAESSSSTPLTLERLADSEALQQSLDALDPHYREPFLMVYVQGQSCQQTADALQIPLGTVLSRLHRAKRHLRESLAARGIHPQGERKDKAPLPFPLEGAS